MSREAATVASSLTLRVTEIFLSLQGESNTVGYPTVFVRTTGCPLRCSYCDTAYAFSGGKVMDHDDILARVAEHGVRHVTVTGGEPLAQPSTPALLSRLCDTGYVVSIETSGALDVSVLDRRVVRVVDVKTPASGEVERNLWSNFTDLTARDQVKFVICDRADYDWSRARMAELGTAAEILFSPGHGSLAARDLADWIVADRLPVRFQIQLHKYLWGDEPGR
ncbi:MAG: 7-carboxy-7-deazaguanine synthase QueE [Gammaproteobacteria bacterium]